MRVISGIYKGKNIDGFNINGTRPTMDRVKESLFGIIQNNLKNSVCLDLFSGSGSLGIEALSNGASECYFIDKNKEIFKILESNVKNIKNAFVFKEDYVDFLNSTDKKFDVIFLDPPYSLDLITPAINIILKNNLLNDNGIIVCEYETENIECNLKIIKEKRYGSKKIIIYKK